MGWLQWNQSPRSRSDTYVLDVPDVRGAVAAERLLSFVDHEEDLHGIAGLWLMSCMWLISFVNDIF